MSTKFKKPLNMTNEEEQEFETAAGVIFVDRSVVIKISGSGTSVISLDSIGDRHIRIVTSN